MASEACRLVSLGDVQPISFPFGGILGLCLVHPVWRANRWLDWFDTASVKKQANKVARALNWSSWWLNRSGWLGWSKFQTLIFCLNLGLRAQIFVCLLCFCGLLSHYLGSYSFWSSPTNSFFPSKPCHSYLIGYWFLCKSCYVNLHFVAFNFLCHS